MARTRLTICGDSNEGNAGLSQFAENVLNATGLGVIITGPLADDTPIIYANLGFEDITGYSPAECIGRNPRFLQGPETDRNALDQLRQAIHNGIEYRVVLRNHRKDGTAYWNEMTISPVPGEGNLITHYVGILTDVTSRVEMEHENVHLLAELQKMLDWQQAFLRDILSNLTDRRLHLCLSLADLPPPVPPCSRPVKLTDARLQSVRHNAVTVARQNGVSRERCDLLEIAVGEAILNAVVHGGGGEAQICADRNHKLQIWVRDHGSGIGLDSLHRATLEPGYSTKGSMGHGFKLMLKCSDRIYLLTDRAGTTICIEEDADAPTEMPETTKRLTQNLSAVHAE